MFEKYSDIYEIKKRGEGYVLERFIGDDDDDTLVIPEGITKIDNDAFRFIDSSTVKKIIFPSTLKNIPDHMCFLWEDLEEIVIPEGVTTIGEDAFFDTGIHEVLLPSTIEKIGKGAFKLCKNLKKITLLHLNDTLLNSLMNKDYDQSVILNEAEHEFSLYFGFKEEINLTKYFNKYFDRGNEKAKFSFKNWFLMYGNYIVGYEGKERSLRTPDKAIGIAPEAFAGNKHIHSIEFSKKINSVGAAAFANCTSLHSVTLNKSLDKIGACAFAGSGVKNITLPEKIRYVGRAAFFDCKNLEQITVKKKTSSYEWLFDWDTYWNEGFYHKTIYIYI